jgi:hypothetical protein
MKLVCTVQLSIQQLEVSCGLYMDETKTNKIQTIVLCEDVVTYAFDD